MDTGHGFVWPEGMPACGLCRADANDRIHVTPARRTWAAVHKDEGPRTSHTYVLPSGRGVSDVLCLACKRPLNDPRHPIGMPSGSMPPAQVARDFSQKQRDKDAKSGAAMGDGSFPIHNAEDLRNAIRLAGNAKDPAAAKAHIKKRAKALGLESMIPDSWSQKAFVAQMGNKLVIAGRATTGADYLPERMMAAFQQRAGAGAHLWVTGRYVEADSPNRNAAYWSTEDLEFGQPSVGQGPINWLHQERHIIGAIADSELVLADRQAAAETGVGNHIVALGAVWPWIYPAEAKIIASASESQSLWFSMECVSRTVACLQEGCGNDMAYADYMLKKDTRCEHMKDGRPRRFVDPIFEGAGIIVPPVRPGWSNADARVLMPEAAKLVERQAAAFTGCSDEEAESVAAQLLAAAEAA